MGLLDDAIREHLELKRLRGADASDVARLEREALGPARRGAAGADDAAQAETLAPPPQPFDAEHAGSAPLVDESPALADARPTLIPGAEPSKLGQDTAEIDMRSVIEHESHEPAGHEHEHPVPQDAPEDDDAEDVLEETPSFLQQAPEHDRLWFEQQPPRDFDFDK